MGYSARSGRLAKPREVADKRSQQTVIRHHTETHSPVRLSWRVRVALVVLLRGVNVGGRRTFRPSKLVEQLKPLDAVNIGAAGTFVIRQPVSQAQLRAELARRLPFDAEIMICHGSEIVAADVSRLLLRLRGPPGHRPVRERSGSVSSLGAVDADQPSVHGQVARQNCREGETLRRRAVPAAHEGHRPSRHVGPDLRCTGNDSQLEHHHRDRQGAGSRRDVDLDRSFGRDSGALTGSRGRHNERRIPWGGT